MPGTRFACRRRRGDAGAAAVEFALILPIFLLLLLGTMQYAMYFFSGQSGAAATREAARRGAVGDLSCTQLKDAATGNTKLRKSAVVVSRKYYDPSYTSISTATPSRAANAIKVGDNVWVKIQYESIDMHIPFIPLPKPDGVRARISETAVARVENVTANTVACS